VARQSIWPDPFVAHHWRSLLAGLERARTPTEVELVGDHAEACFAVEADWNGLWMAVALAPLRAALRFGLFGDEARAEIAAAATICGQLFGRGPRAMLSAPRVEAFLRDNLSRTCDANAPSPGARFGEAGFNVIGPARAWAATAGEPARLAPERFAAEAKGLLERASKREPHPTGQRWIQLWGRRAAPEACDELLRSGARPPVPGLR
jgi:hypothetical protein